MYSNRLSDDFPFKLDHNFYLNRNYRFRYSIFYGQSSDGWSIQVADNLYMNNGWRDSIYRRIATSKLYEPGEYRYSDLGYYYFKNIVENRIGLPLEKYVEDRFYLSLGAHSLGYRPLERFPRDRIIPTENDIVFRKQLIHGHVHDPGAAMIGGVGGHAGLFSNANDLAKLMQMYLNGGSYGGIEYFHKATLDRFTGSPLLEEGIRRGIGFDKPETDPEKEGPTSLLVSPDSFGHTGFTGTLAWVDPDHEIVYIFLSNRIHPNQFNSKLIEMNVRTEIQDVIYRAIKDR
jgi:CubicO group peptidase (beta-lactamase class C family)